MFTGIVRGVFPVQAVDRQTDAMSYRVELSAELREGLVLGASVAVDGVCQTVSLLDGPLVGFDANVETLRVTTLDSLREGALVHIERSASIGGENGGHVVAGHVDGTAEIVSVEASAHNHVIGFRVPEPLAKYIFNKGFVALHGASLTVGDWDEHARTFRVFLIPETLRLTTFGQKKVGDRVNLEIDRQTQVLVDTVERTVRGVLERTAPFGR